jgi:hypothetical protein
MVEDRKALLEYYRKMREEFLAAIEGLSDAQMTEPSIDGWALTDHLAHIALWDDLRAGEVTRISAGHDSTWRMDPAHEAAFSPIAYELRRAMSPAQAKWELEHSRATLLAAISAASDRGLDASLYGEAGLVSSHEAEHAGWIRRWRTERRI